MAGWDPVETTGLPDDLDFTIEKAEFGYDAAYASGEQILLILTASQRDEKGDPIHSYYSLGKAGAWETPDNGRTVVSGSNPPAEGFNKQSLYWKFIEAALASGAASVIQGRGTPDKAEIWEGLTFHMNRVDVDYGGEIGTKKVLLPTKFVGDSGKAEAPQAAAAPTEQPAASTTQGESGVTSLLETKLNALAKVSPTEDSFIEAVMEKLPEASNEESLFGRVLDGSMFKAAHA